MNRKKTQSSMFLFLSLSFFGFAMVLSSQCSTQTATEPSTEAVAKDGDTTKEEGTSEQVKETGISAKPLDVPLKENETRAGKITKESETITGPEAKSALEDWKLYNNKVAFVIHGLRPSQTWSTSTGHIIDASPVDANGKASHDHLEEVFSIISLLRIGQATTIELKSQGGVDQDAVLEVVVKDAGIPIIDSVLQTKTIGGVITIRYTLKPNASHLEISTELKEDKRVRAVDLGDGVLFGDRTTWISSIVGYKVDDAVNKPLSWLAAIGSNVSYMMAHSQPDKTLLVPLTQAAVFPLLGGLASDDGKPATYTRHLFVGDGSIEPLLASWKALHGKAKDKTLTVKVEGIATDSPASVSVLNEKNVALTQAMVAKDGEVSFDLPDGTYKAQVQAKGQATVSQDAKVGETTTLKLEPRGTLQIALSQKGLDGKDLGFVPARVELKSSSFSLRVDQIANEQPIWAPAGTYNLIVSKGLTHEVIQKEIKLEAGQTNKLTESLQVAVDTSGYVSTDMHLHSSPSIDSELPLEQRVSALAAEGVQFAVSSDHDTWTDYKPIVDKLKLTPWLITAIGQEVSPFGFHTNAYPLKVLPKDENRYFAAVWAAYKDGEFQRLMEAPEIWAELRKRYKAPLIQINHPRRGQALLSLVQYDPKKGIPAVKAGRIDDNWDVMEIYNGTDRSDFLEKTLPDYFSFLNQGWFKTAVGNSDSHSAGSRPGIARSLVMSSQSDASKIDVDEITQNLKDSKVIVYGGPMIRLSTPEGNGPGQRIKKAKTTLTIEVQAPSWMTVSYVKLYANGVLQETYPVTESKERVRFKQTITLEPQKDTWYIVMAGDEAKAMAPVYPGVKPLSMTNPIYLDVDGDGFKPTWTP